jgi:hypothetical protein
MKAFLALVMLEIAKLVLPVITVHSGIRSLLFVLKANTLLLNNQNVLNVLMEFLA